MLKNLNESINSNSLQRIKTNVENIIDTEIKCFGSKKSKEQLKRLQELSHEISKNKAFHKISKNKASLDSNQPSLKYLNTELQKVLDFLCDKIKQHVTKRKEKAGLKLEGTENEIKAVEPLLEDLNDPTKQKQLLPEDENNIKEILKTQEIARYIKIKSFANKRKGNSQGKLENIFIHYLLIYERLKESGFDCEKLLLPTRALS